MGDSPPGKEGQRGSAMPKAENPAKRELDQPAEAAGKEAGNRERKKKIAGRICKAYTRKILSPAQKFQKKFLEK